MMMMVVLAGGGELQSSEKYQPKPHVSGGETGTNETKTPVY